MRILCTLHTFPDTETRFFLEPRSNFDFTPFVGDLYQCTVVRLKAADIDQEVKERAISCMGQILCHLGDHLQVVCWEFCVLESSLYLLQINKTDFLTE